MRLSTGMSSFHKGTYRVSMHASLFSQKHELLWHVFNRRFRCIITNSKISGVVCQSYSSFSGYSRDGSYASDERQRERYGTGRRNTGQRKKPMYDRRRQEYSVKEKNDSHLREIKEQWEGDVVYGTSPVLAALEANRRQINGIYVQADQAGNAQMTNRKKKESSVVMKALEDKAEKLGISIKTVSKHDLNILTQNRPHQGVVLDASPLECEKMDVMPTVEGNWDARIPVWLCLDEVTDPQNLGAMLRSAYFLEASGVLLCSRNSAPLSGVVSKASAGALEKMAVHSCRSLPRTLSDAREKGWAVVAAAAEEDSIECSRYSVSKPTILVMGSEGHGIRTSIRRICDSTIRIGNGLNLSGGLHEVDSLNVSVATGILLHSLLVESSSEV